MLISIVLPISQCKTWARRNEAFRNIPIHGSTSVQWPITNFSLCFQNWLENIHPKSAFFFFLTNDEVILMKGALLPLFCVPCNVNMPTGASHGKGVTDFTREAAERICAFQSSLGDSETVFCGPCLAPAAMPLCNLGYPQLGQALEQALCRGCTKPWSWPRTPPLPACRVSVRFVRLHPGAMVAFNIVLG